MKTLTKKNFKCRIVEMDFYGKCTYDGMESSQPESADAILIFVVNDSNGAYIEQAEIKVNGDIDAAVFKARNLLSAISLKFSAPTCDITESKIK